jgi:GGDEF domain-containing protein
MLVKGDSSTPTGALFVCVATAAFCFLSRLEATAYAGLVIAAYGLVFILLPDHRAGHAVAHIGLLVLSLAVGGTLVGRLRVKHQELVRRIVDLTRNDGTPGLLDVRGLDEALVIEVERAGRSGIRFALILAAIDGIGVRTSEALAERKSTAVSAAVARSVRSIDFAGRLATNLFATIAIYTDERGAETLAERMRTFTAQEFGSGNDAPKLSFGIAVYGRHGTSPAALLEAAESALDTARGLGGERSIIAASGAASFAAGIDVRDAQVSVAGQG